VSASSSVHRRPAGTDGGGRDCVEGPGGDVDVHADALKPEHLSVVLYQECANIKHLFFSNVDLLHF